MNRVPWRIASSAVGALLAVGLVWWSPSFQSSGPQAPHRDDSGVELEVHMNPVAPLEARDPEPPTGHEGSRRGAG